MVALSVAGLLVSIPAATNGKNTGVKFEATNDLAAVTAGWPSPTPKIDENLRQSWLTIYEDVKQHPSLYVGFYHTGSQIKVEVPRGNKAEVISRLKSKHAFRSGVAVNESNKSTAAHLFDIQRKSSRNFPGATSAAIDWQRHQVVLGVDPLNDKIRRLAKARYGDDVILEHAASSKAVDSRAQDESAFIGGSLIHPYNGYHVTNNEDGSNCSSGVPWKIGTAQYMLTAGHCLMSEEYLYANGPTGVSTGPASSRTLMGRPWVPTNGWENMSGLRDTWQAHYSYNSDGWAYPAPNSTTAVAASGTGSSSVDGTVYPFTVGISVPIAFGNVSSSIPGRVTVTVNDIWTIHNVVPTGLAVTSYVEAKGWCKQTSTGNIVSMSGGSGNFHWNTNTPSGYTGPVTSTWTFGCGSTAYEFDHMEIQVRKNSSASPVTTLKWYPTGHSLRPGTTTGSTYGTATVTTEPGYLSNSASTMNLSIKQKNITDSYPVTQALVTSIGRDAITLAETPCATSTVTLTAYGSSTASANPTIGGCNTGVEYLRTEVKIPASAAEAAQSSANWTNMLRYHPAGAPSRPATADPDDTSSTLYGCDLNANPDEIIWNDFGHGDLALIDLRFDRDGNPLYNSAEGDAWLGGSSTTSTLDISGSYGTSVVGDTIYPSTMHGDLTDGSGLWEVKSLDTTQSSVDLAPGVCEGVEFPLATRAEKDDGTCVANGDSGSAVIRDDSSYQDTIASVGVLSTGSEEFGISGYYCRLHYTELSEAYDKWGGSVAD